MNMLNQEVALLYCESEQLVTFIVFIALLCIKCGEPNFNYVLFYLVFELFLLCLPCPFEDCAANEFTCTNRMCIPDHLRCNYHQDCEDGSDEKNCPDEGCRQDEFTCANGECITNQYRCDGSYDCTDDSDELNCPSTNPPAPSTCSPLEFECDRGRCLSSSFRCNRVFDCADMSDEQEGQCLPGQFRCNDSSCIPESRRCDNYRDCSDDELNCVGCAENEFQCADRTCLPARMRCNGFPECLDRSDEANCPSGPPTCSSQQFQCSDGFCISNVQRCDDHIDCPDASDEAGCGCRPDEFECNDGSCVPQSLRCDSHYNCSDGSDEQKCGREVVFQCRDEGPRRARVHWVRGNGLPLPPGSRDFNGRLEMPEIQLDHSGTYICEALVTLPQPRPPEACAIHEATCSNGECISKTLDVKSENGGVYRCTVTADSGQYYEEYVLTLQGLILYNGQHLNGSGDFISLGLNDSYVEFRFNSRFRS
ncbi:Putative cysteine-rich protein 14 [Gryllus bimaculatus]|nr:Putative cysteine-rich protein 14 [Gryllus bimaculatus]